MATTARTTSASTSGTGTSTTSPTRALLDLRRVLEAPPDGGVALGNWRWTVRQRLAGVRDLLARETEQPDDGWLVARRAGLLRERTTLLSRLGTLGRAVLEQSDVERVRADLLRLVADVDRHLQRLHDLAYDAVELELGGSE
jgi:hypothetical protein